MKRTLFNFLAIASLLLCVGSVALWVRSYWATDTILHHTYSDDDEAGPNSLFLKGIGTNRGRLQVVWIVENEGGSRGRRPGFARVDKDPEPIRLWFENRTIGTSVLQGRIVTFPLALPVGLFALLPMIWFWQWQRGERYRHEGQCQVCGYDLRATPGRCPECGSLPKPTDPVRKGHSV